MPPVAIRELREHLGCSQASLGRLVGATATAISRWERGHEAPTHFQRQILAAFSSAVERFAAEARGIVDELDGRGPMGTLARLLELATK